ncbi:MAG: DUF2064 domain-containing protein [Alphaproteobacteria bacterium]|nr:DUF2064 domain-containing protein [Alphaproteobacteria bacterium]
MKPVLVAVFAKPPVAGQAKTRLARDLGPVAAADVANALLLDAWTAVTACRWAVPVLATPEPAVDHGLGAVTAWDQGTGDLGARMERVLRRGVAERGRAIAVGADAAGLDPARLRAVADGLDRHAAVIAPSDDGGFWAIGLTTVPEGLLAGLPWSTPGTAWATRGRLRDVVGAVGAGPDGFDVDELADLQRLVRDTDAGRLPDGHAARVGRRLLGPPAARG